MSGGSAPTLTRSVGSRAAPPPDGVPHSTVDPAPAYDNDDDELHDTILEAIDVVP